MADVIGAVASVLALSQFALMTLRTIRRVHHASREIEDFQNQLQPFHQVLQALKQVIENSPSDIVRDILLRAQTVLAELNQVFELSIIRSPDGSTQIRRRAWLRNRTRAVRLLEQLKDSRANLAVALSTELILPARQIESSLAILNQWTVQQRLAELGSDQKSNVQQQLDPNMGGSTNFLPSLERASHPYDAGLSRDSNDVDPTVSHDDSSCHMTKQLTVRPRQERLAISRDPDPASHPEVLPSLRPESYTVTEAFPKLFVNKTFQENMTDFSRTNRYMLWYHKSPRRWIRISISVTVTFESRLWDTAQAGAASGDSAEDLPGNLAGRLEDFLQHRTNLKQDIHLQAYFGGRFSPGPTLGIQLRIADQPFQITAYLRKISSSLRHLCRQYYPETALTQFPMYRRKRKCFYISGVESVWALDFRFGSTKAEIDSSLYHLRALHCLRGTPGICAFMGIVTDDEDGLVKGFMARAPLKGPLFRQISRANRSKKPVPWARREKWCRQITRAVAEVHSKGYAVGKLATETEVQWTFALDEDDNAVLFWLTPTFVPSRKHGTMPPEHRDLVETEDSLPATCYTDLYQLGLLLWRIAEHVSGPQTAWCRLVGCTARNEQCKEPHSEPVQLPPTGPDVPGYIDKVISACREEDPNQRPPAAELLDMFPAESVEAEGPSGAIRGTITQDGAAARSSSSQQLREAFELYSHTYYCDVCGEMCSGQVFHCLVCFDGNYDLCLDCFSKGEHCLDPSHYLQEMLWLHQDHELFYSSVREDGHRKLARGLEK